MTEVVVLGGGIVGAACAWFLAKEGLRVKILESGNPVAGTSKACDGLLLLWDKVNDAEYGLASRSVELWRQLASDLGRAADEALEFQVSGCLALAPDEGQRFRMGEIREKMERWGIGSQVSWLEPDEIHRLEPGIARDMAGALYFPGDLAVDARRATMTLLRLSQGLGARLLVGEGPARLVTEGGKVKGARGRFREHYADAVVVAAGPWTPLVLQSVGIPIGIRPRKGHVLVIESGPPLFRIPTMNVGYAATVESRAEDLQVGLVLEGTRHGTALVGATREFAGYDRSINPTAVRMLAANATRYLPGLADRRVIRTYAGLRPASEDRRPFIGPHRGLPGLYLASGHEGSGITLSMGTGKMIADMIVGRKTFMDPAPFDPGR